MAKEKVFNESIDREKVLERLKKEKKERSRLIDLSGDKRGDSYFIVYHLERENGEIFNLEVELKDKKAERAISIFENADLYERECREMYGLEFGEEMKNLFLPSGAKEPTVEKLREVIEGGESNA